ncbi:SPFH domain-containing protein [Pseudogracilibacillus sp. SE30717A]|uniref:SPFH domain-containing protein n=1 Tax=Pseudogracilibacillus sp. SE30717A TaxID=3098293 RepID=UPI00300E3EA2
MSFFRSQLANVIEWDEFREDMIFWKWPNNEIKKGSKLIIRPGQDAIFFNHGRIEGIFEEAGDYEVDSDIIPFLSTLKGYKFGFASGMRCEVLFVNTKQFTVKWGTKGAIHLPTPQLPGGIPVRANGTFNFKVNDYVTLIDSIAGMRDRYLVEDVKIRITSVLDQLLMKWIGREGKDMFNLQNNASEIADGIKEDLDMQIINDGMTITNFYIMDFNYPKEIREMIKKSASHHMVGDVNKYQTIEMTDGISSGKIKGGSTASDMTGMMMGMNVANEMMRNMRESTQAGQQPSNQQHTQQNQTNDASSENKNIPNFCPNCGTKTSGGNFCSNCGHKLV